MPTLTQPAPVLDEHSFRPPPERRRRPIRVALIVLLLASGALTWVARYEPLAPGSWFDVHGTEVTFPRTYGGSSVAVLTYEADARFDYAFTLRNAGPVAVTVTGVEIDLVPEDDWAIVELGVELTEPGTGIAAESTRRPFEAFTLGSGDQQMVVVNARFNPCTRIARGALMRFDSQTVHTRVFGIPRVMEVSMDPALVVEGPARGQCNRPGG